MKIRNLLFLAILLSACLCFSGCSAGGLGLGLGSYTTETSGGTTTSYGGGLGAFGDFFF